LKDLFVSAKGQHATGISISNADQLGSRIFGQELSVGGSGTDISVGGLDNTLVELHDFQLSAAKQVGLKVVGGPLAQNGNPQFGRTNLLAGSGANNTLNFQASKGASLLVRDAWFESIIPSNYAKISDNSSVTLEGSRMSLANPANEDAIEINDLSCNVAIISSAPDARVRVTGNGPGKVWVLGNNYGQAKNWWLDESTGGTNDFSLNRRNDASGSIAIPDAAPAPQSALRDAVLAQSRNTHPSQIYDLPNGVTDVRFYRVAIDGGLIGVEIER
jgi:hypothetical protein